MTRRRLRVIASALILVALGLLVWGIDQDVPPAWYAGLALVAVAMAMSLATRWVGTGKD